MSVQLENGYTKIANEILDALCRFRIPGEQRQCLDVIFRKTYGFNKKLDEISNSQFCTATGLNKANVCRAIKQLVVKKVVVKSDNKRTATYCFNKNFEQWKQLSKVTTVVKTDNNRCQKRQLELSKVTDTKDTITKDKRNKRNIKEIFLKPEWIKEEEWKDLLESRKAKKLQNSKAALTPFVNQLQLAQKKGYSVRQCLDEFIPSRWTRFKVEWMDNMKVDNNQSGGNYI